MAETFTRELSSAKPTAGVRTEILTTLTSPLNNWGYKLTTQSDSAFTYERTYRPWYVWLIGLIFAPVLIGILLLIFWTETDTITLVLEEQPQGSKLLVQGRGPSKVRDAFQQMQL